MREAIVFDLVPQHNFEQSPTEVAISTDARGLIKLRARALAAIRPEPASTSKTKRNCYERNDDIRAYVIARANGVCEACSKPAPFNTARGNPFLEPHHIRRLSDGGPDNPAFMGAVCPNCHREIHHGEKGRDVNRHLQSVVTNREKELELLQGFADR
jgi:5-methylcytosine-specific restriction protein A